MPVSYSGYATARIAHRTEYWPLLKGAGVRRAEPVKDNRNSLYESMHESAAYLARCLSMLSTTRRNMESLPVEHGTLVAKFVGKKIKVYFSSSDEKYLPTKIIFEMPC